MFFFLFSYRKQLVFFAKFRRESRIFLTKGLLRVGFPIKNGACIFSTTNLELQMFQRYSRGVHRIRNWIWGKKIMVLLMFQKSGVRTTLGCIKPWFNTGIYFPTISTQQCGVFLAPQVFFWGVDFLVVFRIRGGCGERERGARGS